MAGLYAETEIEAPKNFVWQALTRKEKWVRWNTFLFDCDSSVCFVPGQEVLLSLRRLPEDEETEFEPIVILLQPEVCLKWRSSILGLRSEHVFELQEIGFRRTKYVHKVFFSGILHRFFIPFIRQDELQGMKRMARELKRYVELRGRG